MFWYSEARNRQRAMCTRTSQSAYGGTALNLFHRASALKRISALFLVIFLWNHKQASRRRVPFWRQIEEIRPFQTCLWLAASYYSPLFLHSCKSPKYCFFAEGPYRHIACFRACLPKALTGTLHALGLVHVKRNRIMENIWRIKNSEE